MCHQGFRLVWADGAWMTGSRLQLASCFVDAIYLYMEDKMQGLVWLSPGSDLHEAAVLGPLASGGTVT